MTDFLNCPIVEISEQARAAMNSGDDKLASILDALISLREMVEQQEDKMEELKRDSLASWENENGPAGEYMAFFFACFDHLDGHYPCPSITSDYDQSVIFDAICKDV